MAARKKLTRTQKVTAWWAAHKARISALWPIAVPGALAAYVSYGHIMYVTAQRIDGRHNLAGVPLIMPILVDVMMFAGARYVKHSKTFSGRVSGAWQRTCWRVTRTLRHGSSPRGLRSRFSWSP
jgi:hypothetical protein